MNEKCSRTGFQNGLVDFNLSSDRLFVVQVRKVMEGFRAGWTGVTVGHAFTRTGCPPCLGFLKHSDQLEDIQNNCSVLNTEEKKMYILKLSSFSQGKQAEKCNFGFINKSQTRVYSTMAVFDNASGSAACIILPRVYVQERKEINSLQIWSSPITQLFSEQKQGRAGRRRCRGHTQHGEVCTYEISGQMRSDKRMRSCQTQWHGCRNEMRPDARTGGDGGQRDDKQF